MSSSPLRKTPLNSAHRSLGARMVAFAGWEMPVQYTSIIEEHCAVRRAAGIFDVSHMGEIFVSGKDALANLQRLTTNDVSRLAVGQAQYTALTYPQGTFVDDVLLHRLSEDGFFFCVNAANIEKDYNWILQNRRGQVAVENCSPNYAQIAIQGPRTLALLQKLTDTDLASIKNYWFREAACCNRPALLARTGYTGEDGFEVYVHPEHAAVIWNAVLDAGRPEGLKPVGLAARNTLRLEAKMALYGNDIDETTTVLEAGLGSIVKFDKGEFNGRSALLQQKEKGVGRLLVGFEMLDKGIARDCHSIYLEGKEAGHVTSGSYAPYLRKNIGLVYLPIEHAKVGTRFEVVIRQRAQRAVVIPTPFYKRQGK